MRCPSPPGHVNLSSLESNQELSDQAKALAQELGLEAWDGDTDDVEDEEVKRLVEAAEKGEEADCKLVLRALGECISASLSGTVTFVFLFLPQTVCRESQKDYECSPPGTAAWLVYLAFYSPLKCNVTDEVCGVAGRTVA